MRYALFAIPLLLAAVLRAEPLKKRAEPLKKEPTLIARPEAFQTLVNPACSHCIDEAKRRSAELQDKDPVLAWIRGYSDGGAIPYRFFLNSYRVISDSYGVFVYDPDAGFARGFAPSYDFSFYGWRNGVMVMKHKDGTLYSCLTGIAFQGPKKGARLQPISTLVSDWGFWLKHYPGGVSYNMFPKYQPVALPNKINEDSRKSRGSADKRLPADELVLGVWTGKVAKAYPLSQLAQEGMVVDEVDGETIVVLWEPDTKTAAAYKPVAHQPRKFRAPRPDKTGVSPADPGTLLPTGSPALPPRKLTLQRASDSVGAPFSDQETGSRWDITGRAVEGELKGWTMGWQESTQVKWFAWAAEYPKSSIYPAKTAGTDSAKAGPSNNQKPFEGVIVEPETVTAQKVVGWKKEGFKAVVVVLDDRHQAAVLAKAAKAVAANSLELYYWIEVGRNPGMARQHPEWMASLGMHRDWRDRFPMVRLPEKGEVAKVWPWVPIGYQEAFDAHLARINTLLARLPKGYRGLLLNDLQGGPASCGCGNLQCRWAVDYKVPSTATKLTGPDVAAKFITEVNKAAKGKEVIPIWTVECEQEDMAIEKQRPKGGWSTDLCGGVDCFGTCPKKFAEQWSALHADHRGPTGVLLLHQEFQRDRKEYGAPGAWIEQAVKSLDQQTAEPLPQKRLWLVVQGYGVSAEEQAAVRRVAGQGQAGAVLVARTRIDQSYEPRIVNVKPVP